MRRRKKYYHKTIVLRDVLSNTIIFTAVAVFILGVVIATLGKIDISASNSFIRTSFNRILCKEEHENIGMKNVYDIFVELIPSIKSSAEMNKKYSAKYGGVKKDKGTENENEVLWDENKIKAIDMSQNGITFRNETAYTPKIDEFLNMNIDFSEDCEVLIMHTHTSEAYIESPNGRSTDNDKNVVRVGEVIAETLKKNGINVTHDTTRNDYPSYNGSYNKALSNIQKNVEKNAKIQVVLDIHRDYAEQEKDGVKIQLKPVAEVNGENVAQVMFVVGTDANGLEHPEWKKNLAFAVRVQSELNKISPKISRPINLRRERFNQHKTCGSLIVEMGTAGNTLKECENAARYVGEAVAEVLKTY